MDQVSKYYLFLDESGDHSLANVNSHFPVFVLCGVLFEHNAYMACRDHINQVKQRHWANKTQILHSSDIRKYRNGFEILFNPVIKELFYCDINDVITQGDFVVIADAIEKVGYIQRHGKLSNVYELCLSFILERAYSYLRDKPGVKRLVIVPERRGKKEDQRLQEYIQKVLRRGTYYIKSDDFAELNAKIAFRKKRDNVNGLQLADLIAYPIARHVLCRDCSNLSFDVVYPKFYRKGKKVYGLKIYP